MSYDSKKNEYGTKLTKGVSIFVNACKYSTDENLAKRDIAIPTLVQGQTGPITISGGDALFFASSNPYLRVESEIIRVIVDSATQLIITERGAFGTSDVLHNVTSGQVIHGGEADGSCYGYPQLPDGSGCSTPDSFDKNAERELLFIDGQSFDGQIYFNGLESIRHNPVEVKPGEAMAKNASCTVNITNNTDEDVYTVPYPDRRVSKGRLFTKLLARHPYMQNRRLITYTGFEENGNFSKDNCTAREYFIDSVSLDRESISIKCLDPLMLAESSKTKMPAVSNGRLSVAIDNASTQIQLRNPDPDGTFNSYGSNNDAITVRVDNELIDCTVNDAATGLLDIVNRAVGGSEQKDHKINATVQLCIVLENWNPITTIVDWLQTYTNITSRFFGDYTDAESAVVNGVGPVYISKPDAVSKYINNVIRCWAENNIALYYDELLSEIRIKVNSDFQQQPLTLSYETDIKQDSLKITPEYDKQFTRSLIGFAPFDAAKKVDDDNSSIVFQSINLQTELTGTLEPQSAKDFYTQFLTNSDTDIQTAVSGTAREANLNVRVPELFAFEIDRANYGAVTGGVIEEAEIINVVTDEVVNPDGTPRSSNLQILSLKENPEKATYTVKARTYQDVINENDFDFIIDENKENYVLSDEFAPTEQREHTVFIKSGVTIGATNVNNFAFDTGTQAAGVTLKIINRGSILGAGGAGGDGKDIFLLGPGAIYEVGNTGGTGGNAFNATVDTVIDTSQGVIYAGGGGAPSGNSEAVYGQPGQGATAIAGNGGSGGQGFAGGQGGNLCIVTISDLQGDEIVTVSSSNGVDGSRSSAGTLAGISGGAWGESSDESPGETGEAGLAGFAIRSNANSVTIIGDNDLTIKGRRD